MNKKINSLTSFLHFLAGFALTFVSILLALLFFAILGEITLGSIHKQNLKNKLQIIKKHNSPFIFSFYPKTRQIVGGHEANFNNLAFRKKSDTAKINTHAYRIISYGDSINFGYLVGDGKEYASKLEDYFKSENRDIEVINTARGSSPTIYSFHLQKDLPELKPNLVLVEIELSNDLGDESLIRFSGRDNAGLPNNLTSARYVVDLSSQATLASLPINMPTLTRFKLFYLLELKLGNVANKIWPSNLLSKNKYLFNLGFDQWLITEDSYKKSFNQMFETIEAMQKFSQINNSNFLLIILPSKIALENSANSSFAYELIKQAEEKVKQRHINYISLYESFKNTDPNSLFLDFCHPSIAGHDLIAKILKNHIEAKYLPMRFFEEAH